MYKNEDDIAILGSPELKPLRRYKHKGSTKSRDVKHLRKVLDKLEFIYPELSQYWDKEGWVDYWFAEGEHYRTVDNLIDTYKAADRTLKHSAWNQPIKTVKHWNELHSALQTVNRLAPQVCKELIHKWIATMHWSQCKITDRVQNLDDIARERDKWARLLKNPEYKAYRDYIKEQIDSLNAQYQSIINSVANSKGREEFLKELVSTKDSLDIADPTKKEVVNNDQQQE